MTTHKEPTMFEISLDDYRRAIDKDGQQLRSARSRVRNTTEVLKSRVLRAIAAGLSENEAAKISGVTRETIRTWQGK